jgi:hypothetical protein
MRPQKRSRGRNGGGNPYHNNQNRGPRPQHRSQTFDSNGPSVKIRGNAYQVFERYLALAREAQTSGDRVAAENFFQHAEHYFRVMNAQTEGGQGQPRPQYQQTPSDPEMLNGEGEQPDEQQPYDRQSQGGHQNHGDHQGRQDYQGHGDYQGGDEQQGQGDRENHRDHRGQHDRQGQRDPQGRNDRQNHREPPAHVQIQQAPPPPPEPAEDDDELPSFITRRPD